MALYLLFDGPSVGGEMVCPPFQADTLAHAQAAQQAIATVLQRSVLLVPAGTLGPYTTVAPGAANSTINNAGLGISF